VTRRVFAFFLLLFLLVTSREPPWADAHVTYDTTQALVDRFELDVHLESGPPWFYAHRNGKKYGVFPLGNVVAMVPSYVFYKTLRWLTQSPPAPAAPAPSPAPLLTRLVQRAAPSPPPAAARSAPLPPPAPSELVPDRALAPFACHLSPSLLMAGVCALFFHLCRRRGASQRWALVATLALGLGTLIFIYARSPYSEALQTLALLWVVERTLAQAELPTTAGLAWLAVACGVLCNSKLVYVLLLPLVAWYVIHRQRRRGTLHELWRMTPLAILVFAEFSALALWHNHLKTGSPWNSGYTIKDGVFSGDLFAGLYGFLFSSGKSMFLYSPPLVLGLLGVATAWRRQAHETAFLVGVITLNLLFNAKFRHWHADYCWGPRHLTAVTPLLLLLAFPWLPEAMQRGRRALRQTALGVVLGAGICVQLLGAVFYWDHYIRILIAVKDETGASGWFQENLSHGHYIPVFSPLRGHLWMLRHLVRGDPDLDRDAPWKTVVPQPARLEEGWSRMRVDWWPLNFLDAGERAARAGAAGFGLLTFGVLAAGLSLRRELHRSSR
jgi:hypothetical protein